MDKSSKTPNYGENIILKTDTTGKVIYGSIEALIKEIQAGTGIRVAWEFDIDNDGVPEVEHWVDANFLTIMNGHVFNQIQPIYQQIPKFDIPQIAIVASSVMWSAVVGTNGKLLSRFIIPDLDKIEDENVRATYAKHAEVTETLTATTWAKR